MEIFFEIIKIISPACITGIVTFWVTKYNYHKNIPIDKLEIAFNRVYYPIYFSIKKDEDVTNIIELYEKIYMKYNKYVDRTTMAAFRYFKNNIDDEIAYKNFKDNIYSINRILRRRLGYLEPNIFSTYKYLEPREKYMFRITIETIAVCVFGQITLLFNNKDIQSVFLGIELIFAFVLLIEVSGNVLISVCSKICKRIKTRRKK